MNPESGAAGSPSALDALPDRGVPFPLRKALAVGVGNALEFYDFLTFSYFAVQIGRAFFPESQTSHGLLFSLATFGLGFITRPLGGVIIGTYGDRAGRRSAMLLSFSLMGLAIVGLALTPSFAQIGMAAPILLLLFRLVQGFALGGEVGPSTAFLIEAAPPGQRGVYVSIQYATQGVAILAAGIVGFGLSSSLSDAALESWGWRVAFLLGAAIVPVGLYIRRRLPETLHDARAAATPGSRTRVPLTLIVLALLMLGSNTTGTYILNYMNTYAQDSLKLAAHLAFGATITMGICLSVASPVGGWLSDRLGPKPVMLSSVTAMLVLSLPCYLFLNHWRTAEALYAVTALLAFVGQLALVAVMVAIAGALPRSARSAGIAMLYSGAVAVFGGSAQFLDKWLIDTTGSTLAPAWYLAVAMMVGGIAMLAFPTPKAPAN